MRLRSIKTQAYLFRIGGWLALAAMVSMALALPLIHPFLHEHIHWRAQTEVSGYRAENIGAALYKAEQHERCVICDFLAVLQIFFTPAVLSLAVFLFSLKLFSILSRITLCRGVFHVSSRAPPAVI